MKEESLLLLSDLQKLINQVVLIDYTIIILGGEKVWQHTKMKKEEPGMSHFIMRTGQEPKSEK